MDEINWTRITRVTLLSGLLTLGLATVGPLPGATLPAERLGPPQARPWDADGGAGGGAAAEVEALSRELAAARRYIAELEAARAGGETSRAADDHAVTTRAAARVAELSREVEAGWRWIEELNEVLASTCVANVVAQQGGAAGEEREPSLDGDAEAQTPIRLGRLMGRRAPGRL